MLLAWLAVTVLGVVCADQINVWLPAWPAPGAAAYVVTAFLLPVFYWLLVLAYVAGMDWIEAHAPVDDGP